MGQFFKITREELISFAKRLYNEACCGYLDLCETVSDKSVSEFLDGRSPMDSGILNAAPMMGGAFVGSVGGMGGGMTYNGPPNDPSGPPGAEGPAGISVDWSPAPNLASGGQFTVNLSVGSPSYTGDGVSIESVATGRDQPEAYYQGHGEHPGETQNDTLFMDPAASVTTFTLPEPALVREEVVVRNDLNFDGNTSERM